MGKRTRKTRWRTLPIGDEHSDSEESNSTLDTRVPPTYHQKYYNKFTYSSQSTPTRRYQSDSTKSTRSSSTASDNKITFNEDEYTKITTPRQDVLFKKGYLNKPKTYSTQTSTGNSTTSTGNSTGNGTPDYQSTELEYESQFVFPNGFLDQNGIYYVNGYDPYSLMVYNAPTYYNNDSCTRTKKYSTESLTESASTSNEETSLEAAPSANHNGVGHGDELQHATPPPQVNGHHHPQTHMPPPPTTEYGQVYNVVYPGFYYNGLCPPQEVINCQNNPSEPKRIKRRKRRKLPSDSTAPAQNGTASEYTEDEFSSVEEEDEQAEKQPAEETSSQDPPTSVSPPADRRTNENSETDTSQHDAKEDDPAVEVDRLDQSDTRVNEDDIKETPENASNSDDSNKVEKKVKYDLKPDAQEFIPRSMRPENLQYIKIQPGFVPVPLMPPNFGHPAFLPPGVPVGYIPQNPGLYPGFIPGFLPAYPEPMQPPVGPSIEDIPQVEAEPPPTETKDKNDVDIRNVVTKLEEVVSEPQISERKIQGSGYTFRKQGQYKGYEDRKKFFNKNNNTIQNGQYQKRQNGRCQTVNQNETMFETPKQEAANDNKLTSNISEASASENGHKGLEETSKDSVSVSSTSNGPESVEKTAETTTQEETKQIIVLQQPKETPRPSQNGVVKEDVQKPVSSPKFQQKPTNNKMSQSPFMSSKDNNYPDTRNRWPNRDDRASQKRDQTTPENRANNAYKQNGSPNHRFNRRFPPNSPVRKQTANQTPSYANDNSKRYSETVKKSTRQINEEIVLKDQKETKPVMPEVINTPISQTQWISVSNKKKRRNKNFEDSDNSSETPVLEEEEEVSTPETQESKLEDFQQNAFLQNMINGHSKVEEEQPAKVKEVPDIIRKSPVKIMEVRDLEKELLSSVGVEIKEEPESAVSEVKTVEPYKQKSASKKKQKKGGQKQPTKRVFITDIDLSELLPEVKKEEAKEDVKEEEQVKKETAEDTSNSEVNIEPDQVQEAVAEQVIPKQDTVQPEQTEKKNKKKKKKVKNVDVPSASTNAEDTYDLLLENTLSNNSEDKTNMEISQELDLIIQRGMYSNLEEKIKALNIIPIKQEFFQSVVRSSRESSTEKSPEFTKLLVNSMPKFKYCMASVEGEVPKMALSDVNQPSTSRNDLFVENPEVNELLNDIYGKEGTPEAEIGELVTRSTPPKDIEVETVREKSVDKFEVKEEEKNDIDKEKLYPITQAVKNWMSKTRENTPEVEILKSPSKIFKEFCEIEETSNKNGFLNGKRGSSVSESDEEITVYSASRNNSDSVDLLDCWENEISFESERQNSIDEESKIGTEPNEDEEVLEVYESKYGRNEDFLELQREIEEKKKQEQEARSRNFPKHGALPYRAICCNVM